MKKEAGEDERREEDEERDGGGWWSSITEIWVTVALGIIVSSHLPAPDIDSFLFSDAVHMGHLRMIGQSHSREMKRQGHLVPELHSIEFAGMFKQLRPDNKFEKCVLSTSVVYDIIIRQHLV